MAVENCNLSLIIFLCEGADVAATLLVPGCSRTTGVMRLEEGSRYMMAVILLAVTRLVSTGTVRLVSVHSDLRN